MEEHLHHVETYTFVADDGSGKSTEPDYWGDDVGYQDALGYGEELKRKELLTNTPKPQWGRPSVKVSEFDALTGDRIECEIKLDPPSTPFAHNFYLTLGEVRHLESTGFGGGQGVQLIVSKPLCKDATRLLDSFDMTICQASFDGTTFRIPFPHLTFNCETNMEPARLNIIETHLAAGKLPYDKQGAFMKEKKDGFDWRQANIISPQDAKCGSHHNFIMKLILRLQKYQSRGIKLHGVSADILDFKLDMYGER